ncbi:MAG: hypothetical protein AB7E52_03725 [Bdellovibrionales bacterium]
MDTTGQILSGLFGIAMVILLAPRIFALNQGVALRNIALWVAIFLGLAVAYHVIGPGKNMPVSASIQSEQGSTATPPADDAPLPSMEINEENGFSPPQGD